ncbi:MAG: hypothetical protein K8S54_07860 [Spirochaetia bacterium]|nr:hypothetical protein [Spirochaetia bacterium]
MFSFGILDDSFSLEGSLEPAGAGFYRFERTVEVGRALIDPRAQVSFEGRVIIDSPLQPLTIGTNTVGYGLGRELNGLWVTVRIAQIGKIFHGIVIEAKR